jgi:hypothetical protein
MQMYEERQMDRESIAAAVEGWGYRAYPRSEGGEFGYARLLVAIRKEPTVEHYDPQRLRFRLRSHSGEVRWRTATWLVPVSESGHICPGPVALTDRRDKRVVFFTFGGTVEVISDPSVLIYTFNSVAPILELTMPRETVSDHLAYEAEVILAELEERWDEHYDTGFAERLAEIDPATLYVAILNTILQRYRGALALEQAYSAFYAAIEKEKAYLSVGGLWPPQPLQAADLVLQSP